MSEYKVEFDADLWDYVLRIDGETIPLKQGNIRDANWYARVIVEGRKHNDSSTSTSDTSHN